MSSLKETISLNNKNYGIGEGRLLELDTEGNQLNVYQLREINTGFILDPSTEAYELVKLTDKDGNVILEASKGVKGLDEFAKGIRREQA